MQRVGAADASLMDPDSSVWDGISAADVKLDPTPITAQPSGYVQAKWKEISYGQTGKATVQSAHNGENAYFRISWSDGSADEAIRDTDEFADAAAVLFPVKDDAPLQSMGSPKQPVNAWFWRPDLESPFSIVARGTGTSSRTVDAELKARGQNAGGRWSVVFGRSLASSGNGEYVTLVTGQSAKAAFAVWQGANKERGGLKAVTLEWVPLEIEA